MYRERDDKEKQTKVGCLILAMIGIIILVFSGLLLDVTKVFHSIGW